MTTIKFKRNGMKIKARELAICEPITEKTLRVHIHDAEDFYDHVENLSLDISPDRNECMRYALQECAHPVKHVGDTPVNHPGYAYFEVISPAYVGESTSEDKI